MSSDRGPVVGRRILIALLALAVLVHARLVAVVGSAAPLIAVLDGVVAIAAIAALALVIRRADGPALLASAVAGGLGVALFLVPGLVVLAQGQTWTAWLDPWAFGALLLDAMVVRIAVFTLRKVDGTPTRT
ncbi:hypothetical protein Ae168Ps1_3201c [Pseudonocardia sp. Ae168_Ps1]|uniref:hypothetical protein n=1 Tax=unclassified Pseudonocardia TaxID=2619320 RepID=UPI00094B5E00|nr:MULTISPECIES: hypothetical protein [unclassified Pseudonocardia]OLL74803.1 hypothetical protein Ae150APs1_3181c [Pseudonocardia sp. Ae150A_Ps1]OLL80795.1 hypothetical protein Ae168Ps1_3201c [Pseudonocardia sp. Ae168_Ps1]OLL85087.1 hypothetical protein Ae263Ps1_2142 [Pseudonocardia sp. Ae263_Ps1]OLL94896.1 hypothetical protein Ae356Ps1_4793c [Pseudonocardia sp. Ae356_Ps1]